MAGEILYYGPGSCSLVPHIALEESGTTFEARRVVLTAGEQRQPEFLALNPQGRVPVLVHAGQALTEVLAIIGWLDQQYPDQALLPRGHWERARALEWLAWMNGTVHGIHFASVFRPGRFSADPGIQARIKDEAITQIEADFLRIEQALAGCTAYALPSGYSAVDTYLLVLYRWGLRVGLTPRPGHPAFAALVDRVLARPAVVAVFAREELGPAVLA